MTASEFAAPTPPGRGVTHRGGRLDGEAAASPGTTAGVLLSRQVPSWMGAALCAQVDPELFFPHPSGSPRAAKRVCAACPVTAQCLDHALELEAQGVAVCGVWGGTTEVQRRTMRRRDKPSDRAGRVSKAGRLARAGCTPEEIAAELNVHRDTAYKYLREAG